MATPNFGERTMRDFANWDKLQGIYLEAHPTEKGMIRTRRISYNPFANRHVQEMPSNWHHATPTPEMKAWHEGIARALTTMQASNQSRGFY